MSEQLERVRSDVRRRIGLLAAELNKALEDAYVCKLTVGRGVIADKLPIRIVVAFKEQKNDGSG